LKNLCFYGTIYHMLIWEESGVCIAPLGINSYPVNSP
jgi:hypothetical protein